mmetsp:Transcript_34376/g.55159  ORF Transcript_34376/g.55159 Transcript_34376/m.55159 type:complete len:82 (+) Transcript_34376:1418-1663(+)
MYVVNARLAAGAEVDRADKHGLTPIFNAAEQGHEAVRMRLLRCGARVDKPSVDGSTPLAFAMQAGHPAIVAALLGWRERER